MLKLYLHFLLIISIFIISIFNALFIIGSENANVFIKFMSVLVIFFIIFIASFIKNTFLPFLGNCVFPVGLLPNEMYPPKSNFEIELDFHYPDGTKVIYWSAYPKKNDKDFIYETPNDAYGDYKNSGIAIINNKKATLHIYCPNKYTLPNGFITDKHIHYRLAFKNNPILSEVKTVYINC